ncbi:MAG: TolC family protein [Acidobacteria bacterium]|nr:TolC family protein [Acidobacteriota bacterium]
MSFQITKAALCIFVLATCAFAQNNAARPVESFDQTFRASLQRSISIALQDDLPPPQRSRLSLPPPKAPQAATPPSAPLLLSDVLQIVGQNHPKLIGASVERQIASAKRLEKQGAFDPVVNFGSDYLQYNSTTTRGKAATTNITGGGIELLTRSGIKVGAGTRFNLGRVKSPLSATGDSGEYFVEFKVPLLRGWRINEKTAAERQALLGEPLAEAEYEITRLDLLLTAATAYWDWVASKQKLIVARDLLELADFRAQAVADRVKAGDLPAIDQAEAEAEVFNRREAFTKAERDLQKSAFKLSLYLWTADGRNAYSPEPEQAPNDFNAPVQFTDTQAIEGEKLALERRPELRALGLNRQITQVDLDLARNQRRPALELSFSPGRDTGFGAIGTTFKGGLDFTLPLRQRTADGRIGAASFKLTKLELDTRNERQKISTQVFDAVSAINTAYERYRAALQAVTLNERVEAGEREKFRLGDSTLFVVNQRERATAQARIKLIEIQAEYEQAVAAFRTAAVQY